MAEILCYSNPQKAIRDHVDEEDKTTTLIQGTGSNYKSRAVAVHVDNYDKRFEMLLVSGSQNGNLVKTAIINESGLYPMI